MKISELNGLVLIGGRSQRMGKDKAFLEYQAGKPQLDVMFEMLGQFCQRVYISKREDQPVAKKYEPYVINDMDESRGPLTGILSAFGSRSDCAWLVAACDLPCFQVEAVKYLIEHRQPEKLATAFRSMYTGDPDPLCAIYEPGMGPVLSRNFEKGRMCPRHILREENVCILNTPDPLWLENINTPQERNYLLERNTSMKRAS